MIHATRIGGNYTPPAAASPARPPQVSRLVLSRCIGEEIAIDGPAIIRIVDVDPRDGKVRIAIEAERHVTIVRTELLERRAGGAA